MSGLELLHNPDAENPHEAAAIYTAVIVVASLLGGMLACCVLWSLCKALFQSTLDPPPEFTDCMLFYCNNANPSEVYWMLCMPRVRRGRSTLSNYGCCFFDSAKQRCLFCIDLETPLRKSRMTELGEMIPVRVNSTHLRPPAKWVNCGCCYLDGTTGNVLCCEQPPATSISSATPNEVQAGPVSGVPLAALSSAPPPTSTMENIPVKTGPLPAPSVTGRSGVVHSGSSTATGEIVLEIPLPEGHHPPPRRIDMNDVAAGTPQDDVPMAVLFVAPAATSSGARAGPERIVMDMSASVSGTRQLGTQSSM